MRNLLLLFLLLPAQTFAATISVSAGGDVQAALAKAQPGDEVVLQSGVTFAGTFTLPSKPVGAPITLRSSTEPPSRRVTAADRPGMATLQALNVEPVLGCFGVTGRWVIRGVNFGSNPLGFYDLIAFDDCNSGIVMDRIVIVAGPNGQKRGIRANSSGPITLQNSHIENIWAEGQDSQGFCAWDGAGPFTLTNNYIEAAGENVMFGGAASRDVAHIPADILVEGNDVSKRDEWRSPSHPSSVKNLFELKAAKRVTVRNNRFSNNWTDAQNGYAILFTVRNDDGAHTGDPTRGAPWTVVEDVLFEQNILDRIENGINIIGYDIYAASGRATRITIRHNVVDTAGTFLQVGGEFGDLTVEHNTVKNGYTFLYLYPGGIWPQGTPEPRPAQFAVELLVLRNNLGYHNDYGVFGEEGVIGTLALERWTTSYSWTHNVLAGVYPYGYPMVTMRPTVPDHEAQFQALEVPYSLTSASVYRGAGSDNTDLGRVSTTARSPIPPPTIQVR